MCTITARETGSLTLQFRKIQQINEINIENED